jgi:tetratricopeptide (TPR) repeat protein/serine/threonine protein kinase
MSTASPLERIFFECLQRETPQERAAFLAQACAGDAELLRRLQKMLEAHASGFLEQAACVPGPGTEQSGQRVGAYLLVEPLGEGGMGTVWRAEQVEPVRRQVALKLIKAGMDSRQVIARFEAERQALALMDHPNIARVLDGGADAAGRPYFVMDLFAGVPITRFCEERRLALRQRLELFAQVCEAIQHAHQKGVIHRDIKPSNVLVALQDGRAVPKVIDFGIAKAIEPKPGEPTVFTQQGGFLGTLEYMSPEQSARSAGGVDTRSDIYSLGVLLYELLTGGTPLSRQLLEESSLADILRVIADGETPKPSTRLRETGAARVSGELDWIVMKALEKDRDRRYATASDLGEDVRRFLADEPVLAGPPSALYRLRKLARRRRGALTAASVLVAALLVAIGGIGWAVGDRAARKTEAERVASDRRARVHATVQELLGAADQQMAARSWSEALATVRRADAAATSGEADAATARGVRVLLEDLEFVERLDRIRSEQAMWIGSGSDGTSSVREYEQAFLEHGVDLEGSSVESAIERLGRTPSLAIPLAAGLDDLARRQLEATRLSAACARYVLVANALDPEPLRSRIRAACNILDAEELQCLADSVDAPRLHPATIVNLARALSPVQPQTSIRLLREAQRAHPGDFWVAFELGHALLSQKDFEGALLYYTAAVAIRPDSAAAHSNLGYVLINKPTRDVAGAFACFRRTLELEPSLAMGHVNMCRVLIELRRPAEALAAIRRALALDPGCAMAWVGLGQLQLLAHQVEEAGNAYQRALELEPKLVAALAGASDVLRAQGKLPEAIARARQAVAAGPREAGGYISLGNALAESRAWAPSAEAFRKAIEIEPGNAIATGNLGNVLGNSKDPARREEAVALCRKSVELDPGYAVGQLCLGTALLRADQKEAAVAAYRKAVELDPTLCVAYFNLGQVLSTLNRADEALDAYRKVVELDPGNANAYHSLGVTLRALGRHEESLAAKRRAAEIEPAVAMRHMVVADSLYELQRYDESAAACRKAIGLDPRCRIAFAMLGLVLRQQENYAEAIAPLAEAVRLDPQDASITGVLAMLLVTCPDPKLHDPPRALELARKALELEPGNGSHSRTLGVALYRSGNWQEALAALKSASERDPDNTGFDSFFVAMAHQRLGDALAARAAYDRACEQIERKGAEDRDARRAHEEAAGLLGIEIPPR